MRSVAPLYFVLFWLRRLTLCRRYVCLVFVTNNEVDVDSGFASTERVRDAFYETAVRPRVTVQPEWHGTPVCLFLTLSRDVHT